MMIPTVPSRWLRARWFCFVLTLAPFITPAQEATPGPVALYNVELVIFRPLSASQSAEELPATVLPAITEPVEPIDPADDFSRDGTELPAGGADSGFETPPPVALEPNRLALGPIYGTLRRSAGYRPLAQLGWMQEASALGRGQEVDLTPLLETSSPVRATVKLERGRYLHLTLDVEFDSPEDGRRYTIHQTRRMRSGERHYFDHPNFGVIALITPYRETGTPGAAATP